MENMNTTIITITATTTYKDSTSTKSERTNKPHQDNRQNLKTDQKKKIQSNSV